MDGILQWGVKVILWFQQLSPSLDLPFKVFSYLGEEEFFMLLLPLLYWCLERRTAIRLTVLFLISTYVNAAAKVLAAQPRPFQYDPRVRQLYPAEGQGFPSGHTQSSVVVWGYLASQFPRTWLRAIAVLLIVLIPLSRVYLGVHFPTDLLGGYVIGALLLWLYLRLEPGAEAALVKRGLYWQLAAVIALALLMLLFPFGKQDEVTAAGTLMGMGIGFALERRWVQFDPGGLWWKRALRLALGVAVLFGLRFGLKAAFDGLEPAVIFRFVRYAAIGLWGGLGAPWAFVRLRLADTR